MKSLAIALLLGLCAAASGAVAQVAPGSVWENTRGSVLTIHTVDANGALSGEYVNNATGFGCQGTAYPVVGWVNGDAVGWSVDWANASEDCNSVTSWGGVLLSGGMIEAIWSLGYTGAQGPRVMVGTDYFTKR